MLGMDRGWQCFGDIETRSLVLEGLLLVLEGGGAGRKISKHIYKTEGSGLS